jgi:hypothetical protein
MSECGAHLCVWVLRVAGLTSRGAVASLLAVSLSAVAGLLALSRRDLQKCFWLDLCADTGAKRKQEEVSSEMFKLTEWVCEQLCHTRCHTVKQKEVSSEMFKLTEWVCEQLCHTRCHTV